MFRKYETIRRIQILAKIALVDLDGVLNEYTGKYNEYEVPKVREGAKDFLEKLSENYDIEIFTVRNKIRTVEWLQENGMIHLVKEITNVKNPYASIIIDDRAISFNGDYQKVLECSVDFKPYWKN